MSYKSINLAGHYGVGKTHMFHRFNTGKWPDSSFSFWNGQQFVKDFLINGKILRVYINDFEEDHEDWERLRYHTCLLYTSPSPRDKRQSRMPSSA